MRKYYPLLLAAAFLFLSLFLSLPNYGQSVGIGTSTPNASAQLDISSASRGLLIPRMDSNAVKAIGSPAAGLMVYDSSRNQLLVNMGTAATPDWENIVAKSGWGLSGNSGTGAVLGTTDRTPLVMMSGGQVVGQLIGGSFYEIAIGPGALGGPGGMQYASTIGIGGNALSSGGNNCIAIGDLAMGNNSGANTIALGFQTAQNNAGGDNIAIGNLSLFQNSGSEIVSVGERAGQSNTSGNFNTFIGSQAGKGNTTGTGNTAVGGAALEITTQSLYNTVVGFNSAVAFDNGYNNVFIGANNDVNGAGYFNVVAIGQQVTCTASSQARIGNEATNSIGGYAGWTNFSDGRYKKNMQEDVKGLDFIMRLRPLTYNLDVNAIRSHLGKTSPKDAATRQALADREATVMSGFSAQEVEQAAAAAGYEFSGIDKPKNSNDFYGLRYSDFVVPLVKAVQEQQQLIKALQQEVAELKKQIQH